jgi:hypothetical protein
MADTIKIKLHSMTDLITNSSTVIYTYSEASLDALKLMVNEFFKLAGVSKTCDEVFTLTIGLEDDERYCDALDELDEEDLPEELKGYKDLEHDKRNEKLDEYFYKVSSGKITKPEWMEDVESGTNGNGYQRPTTLNISAKLPEYEKLAKLVTKFLYSPKHEACYNG